MLQRKFNIFIFISFILFQSSALAEETSLVKGAKTLSYRVSGDSNISGRIMTNNTSAFIIGVGYRQSEISDSTKSQYSYASNDIVTNESSNTYKTRAFTLTGGYRKYLATGTINYFTDMLINLIYGKHKKIYNGSSQFNDSAPTIYNTNNTYTDKGIGFSMNFGAEYFFSKNLSIEGKAGASFSYIKSKGKAESDGIKIGDLPDYQRSVNVSTSGIYLNVYW